MFQKMENKYKDITREDIEKAVREYFNEKQEKSERNIKIYCLSQAAYDLVHQAIIEHVNKKYGQ